MSRIAYKDEYPWIRCQCGYTLNSQSDGEECPGCGRVDYAEYFDRFASSDTRIGTQIYEAVPYEDRFRKTFS